MPSREGVSRALSGVGDLLGNLAQIQLQNKLLTDRQRALVKESQEAQGRQGAARTGIAHMVGGRDIDPDVLAGLLPGVDPDLLASLAPSGQERVGSVLDQIAGITDQGALSGFRESLGRELSEAGVSVDELPAFGTVQSGVPFAFPPLPQGGIESEPASPARPPMTPIASQAFGEVDRRLQASRDEEARTVAPGGPIEAASAAQARGQIGEELESFPERLEQTLTQLEAIGDVERGLAEEFLPFELRRERLMAIARFDPELARQQAEIQLQAQERALLLEDQVGPLQQSEVRAAGFLNRAIPASDRLAQFEVGPEALTPAEIQDALQVLRANVAFERGQDGLIDQLFFNRLGQALGELNERQAGYLQAANEWTLAVLRPETGAAISSEEYLRVLFAGIRTQQDTTPDLIAAKHAAREGWHDGLRLEARRVLERQGRQGIPFLPGLQDAPLGPLPLPTSPDPSSPDQVGSFRSPLERLRAAGSQR